MSGVTAIQGVDDILRKLASDAVASLTPKPDISIGPLDRQDTTLRLNWFLYRINPDPSYRNMEPPRTGWQTARGNPPLALPCCAAELGLPASIQIVGRPGADALVLAAGSALEARLLTR